MFWLAVVNWAFRVIKYKNNATKRDAKSKFRKLVLKVGAPDWTPPESKKEKRKRKSEVLLFKNVLKAFVRIFKRPIRKSEGLLMLD